MQANALFALWCSFSQRQEAKLLSMSLFLPSNPIKSTNACPLIRDGSDNVVDAKDAPSLLRARQCASRKDSQFLVPNPSRAPSLRRARCKK
jgi:hypothetical protein